MRVAVSSFGIVSLGIGITSEYAKRLTDGRQS
jgi:hypothetical protein